MNAIDSFLSLMNKRYSFFAVKLWPILYLSGAQMIRPNKKKKSCISFSH